MRAQASLEYLIIVGVALLILTPAIFYANEIINSSKKELRRKIAENTVEIIAENSDWVYSLGEPSMVIVKVYVPELVEYINISQFKVAIKFKDSPEIISKSTRANITGFIPSNEGYYNILIKAEKNFVNVSVIEWNLR